MKPDVTEPLERGSIKRGGAIKPPSAKVKAKASKLPQKVGRCKPMKGASKPKRT